MRLRVLSVALNSDEDDLDASPFVVTLSEPPGGRVLLQPCDREELDELLVEIVEQGVVIPFEGNEEPSVGQLAELSKLLASTIATVDVELELEPVL